MDPGPQIYLSNNNKKFWSKIIFEHQKQKYIYEKKLFSRKKLEKQSLGKKYFSKKFQNKFLKNKFENLFFNFK